MAQLPRHCPVCDRDSIIGHGRRRRQAHDDQHDWIWVRRGRCPACKNTFTVLPSWAPPSGLYSYRCRQQAGEQSGSQQQLHCLDTTRLPDESTLRRWARRRFLSLLVWLTAWSRPAPARFSSTPTILAWDFPAAARMLCLEADSP